MATLWRQQRRKETGQRRVTGSDYQPGFSENHLFLERRNRAGAGRAE